MKDDYDPYEYAREARKLHPGRWLLVGSAVLFGGWGLSIVTGLASLPFQAASTTVGTVQGTIARTMNADNALAQYRYFHDADARLKVFPAQIRAARQNLAYAEKNSPDRSAARMTELTGITQVCESLVADYNSRAQRLDSGFFRNPERWLPVAAAPWEALPQGYDPTYCEGKS